MNYTEIIQQKKGELNILNKQLNEQKNLFTDLEKRLPSIEKAQAINKLHKIHKINFNFIFRISLILDLILVFLIVIAVWLNL